MLWARALSNDFSPELISSDMAPLNHFRGYSTNEAQGNARLHEDTGNSGRKIRRFSLFCLERFREYGL